MNEEVKTPAKWLQYLLYVGIAAAVKSLLVNLLPGGLSRWLGFALSALSIYLLFQLIASNARYKTAALFCTGSLICNLVGIQALALAASICAIVGQYQEYNAHGELIAERDYKFADKWSKLFWLQFAVELIGGLLISMVAVAMTAAGGMEAASIIAMATVAISSVTVCLKVVYLVYLHRTIRLLETEVTE